MSNTTWPTRSAARVSSACCVLGIASLAAPPLHAQEVTGSSGWQFAATIYGWLPDIGGDTELPLGGGGTINVDVSTILDHLKMTGMGSFEFSKGRWGGFTDLIYLNVGDSGSRIRNLSINGVPIPASVTAAADLTSSPRLDSRRQLWGCGWRCGHVRRVGRCAPRPYEGRTQVDLHRKLRADHAATNHGQCRRIRRSVGRDRRWQRAIRVWCDSKMGGALLL